MRHVPKLLPAIVLAICVLSCGGDDSPETLQFSPDELPAAQLGVAYSATITVMNGHTPVGDIRVSSGALPAGLNLHYVEIEDNAQLTGTPESSGTYPFTIAAWCMGTNERGQTGEKAYSIEVRE